MHAAISNAVLDPARLDELVRLRLLDTPPEEPFDRLTRLAARTLNAPVALVSLVDDHRQFFKSSVGLPEPWCSRRETPLSHSFCQHVVTSAAPLVINDARLNPLVSDNPAVAELGVIAYLGVPLTTPAGRTLGSFCVIVPRPMSWRPEDTAALRDLAASVMSEIALRCAHDDLFEANAQLRRQADAREEAIRRLTQSEARLSAAQRLAHVGSFELHVSRQTECGWSDEARRILGMTACEPPSTVAEFIRRVVHPDDRDRVAHAMKFALELRGPAEVEYRAVLADGRTRTLLTAVEPVKGTVRPGTVVCTAFDITERREAEAAMAEQRIQFLHVARVATAGEMAAVMAHEINQPLAAISHTANACERLLRLQRLSQGEQIAHLSDIASQAKRASEVIRRIGSFVKKQPFSEEIVDIERVVGDVMTLVGPVCWRNNVMISRSARLPDATVLGDEVQLVQLLSNLVRNAIDAVVDKPPALRLVSVTIERGSGSRLVVSVSDNGPGIAADMRERIFEPFFTTRPGGLGMGLAICRTIAECHGAELSIDATQGAERGSCFRLSFGSFSAARH